MAEEIKCPHCGKPVPPGTPGGLCPECMVKVGIGSEAATAPASPKRPAPSPPSLEVIARHFPQLEIIELLGSGGMGAVYKARQREIDRLVALKILPSETAGDPGFAERFTREARALARLSHPNIVGLYHFGHVNGLHYFIMEYVDGLNLRQLEQAGKLSPREALQIIPQICEALQFAHDEGIVHRDIKPENVLLDKKGRVKIADFGLARILGHEPEDFRLTRAREVMGTPHYMAPEQVEKPQTVDHRADIYSLGVVFYEMLTGELPLGKFLPPSQKVQIDVRLDDVVLRALEKEPERRYQHASEVKTDMETILTQPPASTAGAAPALPGSSSRQAQSLRRAIVVAAAGVLVLVAIGLAWVWKKGNADRVKALERGVTAEREVTARLLARRQAELAAAPTPPSIGTNAHSAEAVREAFARRYGIPPPPSSPPSGETTGERFRRRYGLRPSSPPSATNASSSFPSRANGTAPTVSAQTSPEEAAVNGAVYRQANRITLRQRLTDARAAQECRAFASAAKLYDDAWELVLRIGPGVDAERDQTITGLTAVRMELARAAQSHGDYTEARTQVDDVLRVDPTSAMAIEFKSNNELASSTNGNFSVAAAGTNPITYQWYHALNDTTGVTNPRPEGLVLTRLAPLYVALALEAVTTNQASGPRYIISVEDAAAPTPGQRSKRQFYCSIGPESDPRRPFIIRDVQGPTENPTVVLELNATKESVSLDKDHSFQRVRGYAADLKYGPEDKTWLNRRVGSTLAFGGHEYEIVAITSAEVVLRQMSDNKEWTVKYEGEVGK